jgi:tRNA(fMet)-specific endonuclease VapC
VKYLLDTDHISFLQRRSGKEHAALTARMAQHSSGDFVFSIISLHEQFLGVHAYLARTRKTADLLRGYLLFVEVYQGFQLAPLLSFDASAGRAFDALQAQNLRLATMDLRIGAIALSQNLILLTRNVGDFGKIPGLLIEDWTK